MFTRFAKLSRALAVITLLGLSHALVAPASAHTIPVPQQVSPADGKTFNSSRSLTFTWDAVSWPGPGEAKYGIEIQYLDSSSNWHGYKTADDVTGSDGESYTFANFTNSDYGRWRVRAMTSQGNGNYSNWRLFSFNPALSHTPISPSVSEVSKQISLAAYDSRVVNVACPSGTIVTGGGWRSGDVNAVRTVSSLQNINGWEAEFQSYSSSAVTVYAYAECLAGVSGYSVSAVKSQAVQGNQLAAPQAHCSSGIASGGGFLVNNLPTPFESMPNSATDWLIIAYSNAETGGEVDATAVCLVGADVSVSSVWASKQLAPNQSDGVSVSCPNHKTVLSGGFGGQHDGVLPRHSSKTVGNGWQAFAQNTETASWNINVWAVCAQFN
jgi:hypothetical protein